MINGEKPVKMQTFKERLSSLKRELQPYLFHASVYSRSEENAVPFSLLYQGKPLPTAAIVPSGTVLGFTAPESGTYRISVRVEKMSAAFIRGAVLLPFSYRRGRCEVTLTMEKGEPAEVTLFLSGDNPCKTNAVAVQNVTDEEPSLGQVRFVKVKRKTIVFSVLLLGNTAPGERLFLLLEKENAGGKPRFFPLDKSVFTDETAKEISVPLPDDFAYWTEKTPFLYQVSLCLAERKRETEPVLFGIKEKAFSRKSFRITAAVAAESLPGNAYEKCLTAKAVGFSVLFINEKTETEKLLSAADRVGISVLLKDGYADKYKRHPSLLTDKKTTFVPLFLHKKAELPVPRKICMTMPYSFVTFTPEEYVPACLKEESLPWERKREELFAFLRSRSGNTLFTDVLPEDYEWLYRFFNEPYAVLLPKSRIAVSGCPFSLSFTVSGREKGKICLRETNSQMACPSDIPVAFGEETTVTLSLPCWNEPKKLLFEAVLQTDDGMSSTSFSLAVYPPCNEPDCITVPPLGVGSYDIEGELLYVVELEKPSVLLDEVLSYPGLSDFLCQ
ncbi:MAG: hypothetical protein MJ078_01800, partial [Clostridia bacterium]|nr:hypothetical protein [Clostridia bacterium]